MFFQSSMLGRISPFAFFAVLRTLQIQRTLWSGSPSTANCVWHLDIRVDSAVTSSSENVENWMLTRCASLRGFRIAAIFLVKSNNIYSSLSRFKERLGPCE